MSAPLWRWWLTTAGWPRAGAGWRRSSPATAADAAAATARWAAAVLATENGDCQSAIEQGSRALRAFDSLGTVDSAAKAATVLGAAYRYLGDSAQAIRYLEVAAAIALRSAGHLRKGRHWRR